MAEHRCDPRILDGTGGGPLTLSRTLRIVLAVLDDCREGGENANVIAAEIAGCVTCAWSVAMGAAGAAASYVQALEGHGVDARARLEAALAAALDELGDAR